MSGTAGWDRQHKLKTGWCTHWKEHKQALSKHGGTCLCKTSKSLQVCWARLHIAATVRKGSLRIYRKSTLNGLNVISHEAG